MEELDILTLVMHPELRNERAAGLLRNYIEEHPCDQTARLLLLDCLFRTHSPEFGEELGRQAPLVASRKRLFEMIEGDSYKIEPEPAEPTQEIPEGDRTLSLINDFLAGMSAASGKKHTTADATQDYMAFFLQQTEAPAQANASLSHTFHPSPPESEPKKSAPPATTAPEVGNAEPDREFFTETMAGICIKQGKYQRALEIIRYLNANNRKKSSYFADQIRFLEQLIELNKNKEGNV